MEILKGFSLETFQNSSYVNKATDVSATKLPKPPKPNLSP
jgi:hypothetical protein